MPTLYQIYLSTGNKPKETNGSIIRLYLTENEYNNKINSANEILNYLQYLDANDYGLKQTRYMTGFFEKAAIEVSHALLTVKAKKYLRGYVDGLQRGWNGVNYGQYESHNKYHEKLNAEGKGYRYGYGSVDIEWEDYQNSIDESVMSMDVNDWKDKYYKKV